MTDHSKDVVVRIDGLHKSFGQLEVVKGVDMEVHPAYDLEMTEALVQPVDADDHVICAQVPRGHARPIPPWPCGCP